MDKQPGRSNYFKGRRQEMTQEEKEQEREAKRIRYANRTPEQVQAEQERRKIARAKAAEERREGERARHAASRANMTPEQADLQRDANRERQETRRQNMTPEEREQERDQNRAREEMRRQSLTPEERITTRENARARVAVHRQNRTPEERESDLNRRRIRVAPARFAARDPNNKPPECHLGPQNHTCFSCQAIHFQAEQTAKGTFSGCCASGSVALPQLSEYPLQFKEWLMGTSADAKNFRENIRKYNSAFAMASLGYQPVRFPSGPQPLVIHGQIYHRTSQSLIPTAKPSYSQLYFLDPEFATQVRLQNEQNAGCAQHIMEQISTVIQELNPFAKSFRLMKDVIGTGADASKVHMWITKDRSQDPRRYNLPTASEVAAVFVSEDGEPPFERDIAVYPSDRPGLQNISFNSPNCDPMIYPILFPFGEPGWQPNIQKVGCSKPREPRQSNSAQATTAADQEDNSRTVTMCQFYSYRLQERTTFNPLLHARKLSQQYIIDAYLKVEGQRLYWNRQNQKKLRVDLYMGLMDYVNTQAEQRDLKAGRIVILPSTFTGSKRCMQQNYQDAMVLVARFGKPDLFVTFTCNPKWKEIESNLRYNETAIDRPDLVSTVFQLKLREFMNDLTNPKGGVLGTVKAYLSVIEFQKRGLPHCHILLIYKEDDKFREAADVDSVVSAEIPDPEDSTLNEIVKSCMIHGPCGSYNKNAPCMAEEKGIFKCSKDYPKSFREETIVNVDGYPGYRRRNNGRTVIIRGTELDNRWVVPYNPYLTRKYNAHINVEICSSVQSVKYIFKYIYKGHDAAVVKVSEATGGTLHWDEIQTYLDTRYISSPEAIRRLRKYDLCNCSHSVERLPVHLPSHQVVIFEEGAEQDALQRAEKAGTKLTKWFELNRNDPAAREFLYVDIPYHYVWRKNNWNPRQRGAEKILSRLYSASPKDMERFALRMLLLHIKGAQSFDDLKTINGTLYGTFLEAAKAMNLLDDDSEWTRTMNEACIFRMPCELRILFATILIHGLPTDPKLLYESYKASMYEDYIRDHSEYMAEQQSLRDIQNHLLQFGKKCLDFGLPDPKDAYDASLDVDYQKEEEEADRLVSMMNAEQCTAFGIIMDAVTGSTGQKCFFLSGAGGCGKTFIYKALTSRILGQGGIVKAVAPTGLAATLLKGGKTVHTGFGIPIDLSNRTVSRFKQGSPEWNELQRVKLIIWDEISMCHIDLFQAVDRSLRDLMNKNEPFGGIPIVVGGDFRQQAPVVIHGNRVKIVEACVKSSSLWKYFRELKLLRNMRVNAGEAEFADWLLDIGAGLENGNESDFAKLPSELLTTDIVKSVFGESVASLKPEDLACRAVLCPKNEDTLKVNLSVLRMLNGEEKAYYSVDTIEDCDTEEERAQYPLEFLNSLTPMGMPPHCLTLKKGSCVMLLRNLNPKRGLCNGTRLIVESMGTNLIECSIFSGDRRGERIFIPRICLDLKNSDLPFQLKRKQFPLRLAYSMTITKSQGQTFDRIGLYLPEPVFTHGQLYTAFSRVRSKEGLSLEIRPGGRQGVIFENNDNNYTYNCVYREILN